MTQDTTFHVMSLPTITLHGVIGLEGPFVVAWDRQRGHAGAAPLGGAISIARPDVSTGPWWILKDATRALPLPWCNQHDVRSVAKVFGIVGRGMDVDRCFYSSMAWHSLIDLIREDSVTAGRWADRDAYCRGWFASAMREIRSRR